MRKSLFGFGIMVFIVLSLMSPVMADFVTVPATAFKSGSSSYEARWNPLAGDYVYLGDSGSGWIHAPVYLPDGVAIKNMRVVYYDNDADDLMVELHRQNVFALGDTDILFEFSSSGASTVVQYGIDSTTPINSYRKVQNGPVTWYISVNFGEATTSLRIYSIQIGYQ